MNLIGGQKLANPNLTYDCPRCGDTYDCATEEGLFDAGTHRLLHLAGAWKRSLRPATERLAEPDRPWRRSRRHPERADEGRSIRAANVAEASSLGGFRRKISLSTHVIGLSVS